jgi:hypothetical protein
VLPTGYAFNRDGSSLFMSMGVMFIAHAYGVPITFNQQIGILLLMLLTSKGAATVSGGSFVVFAATVTSTGILPIEGLAVIFGVYRFMSMAISACNTIGNSVATVVIAKWARTFDPKVAERHLYPASAKRFLAKALGGANHPHPRVINTDELPAYPPAIVQLKAEGAPEENCGHRPVQYLNNVLEQDHRAIKRRVRASQYFRSFWAAWRTIAGYEAIHIIRKGQVCESAAGAKVGLLHRSFSVCSLRPS